MSQVVFLAIAGLLVLQTLIIVVLLLRHRARLKRTEYLYRSVIETQTELICRYLPDTTLTFANEAYCRYFGRKREELLGTKFIDLIPENERKGVLEHITSLLNRPRTVAVTHRVIRPDGDIGWQEWIDHAIVDADGRVTEFQGVGRDVTDLKLAEQELRRQREQVTRLTRVTTLGELTGALAHELNQPLTAILNNAEAGKIMLEQEPPDIEQLRAILTDIMADDIRAGQIIRRLHGLFKNGEFQPQRIDVGELVSEALALVHGPLLEQNIRLVYDIPADLPAVVGDRVQLLQLMVNLLMNASEALITNAANDREVRVMAATGDADDDVLIAVADNGCGFAPQVAKRLFEPFFSTKENGLGLGLSVSSSIVAAHGGQLEAGNNDERGAIVSFTLPHVTEDRADSARAVQQ